MNFDLAILLLTGIVLYINRNIGTVCRLDYLCEVSMCDGAKSRI